MVKTPRFDLIHIKGYMLDDQVVSTERKNIDWAARSLLHEIGAHEYDSQDCRLITLPSGVKYLCVDRNKKHIMPARNCYEHRFEAEVAPID